MLGLNICPIMVKIWLSIKSEHNMKFIATTDIQNNYMICLLDIL